MSTITLSFFFILLLLQRFVELLIAKRNEKWIKEQGGVERGREHYKFFIIIHSLFFISILVESTFWHASIPFQKGLFTIFILTQLGRIWCIQTLGKFWNTKIIILPDSSLVEKGPYRFIKHPNYVIVAIELFIIPLLFGAVMTACMFPLIHILFVYFVRIPIEEAALAENKNKNNKEGSQV